MKTVFIRTLHQPGPFWPGPIQKLVSCKKLRTKSSKKDDPQLQGVLGIAIVTARMRQASRRVVTTSSLGVSVMRHILLWVIGEAPYSHILRPNMFYDDRFSHLESAGQ